MHRSNSAEQLVEALAQLVRTPVCDPGPNTRALAVMDAECIAVQSKGMERWLSMQLARRLGIWANPDFPFPRRLVERLFEAVLGPCPQAAAYAPSALVWAVAAQLPELASHPAFSEVARYLGPSNEPARVLQLASRMAGIFDEYVVYRPEQLRAWESGTGSGWQATLWRALAARHGTSHLAARAAAFVRALRGREQRAADLPARVSVFGVTTLPPLFVHVLAELSRCIEVHLFVTSPTRHYVGDLRPKEPVSAARMPLAGAEDHPLLASLGRVGREFQQILEQSADYRDGSLPHADPGSDSALHAIQSDMLHLRDRSSEPATRLELAPDDDSITIHACHATLREVQVVHDRLLALLERDPSLETRDIVLMTPCIESYAPVIEAVFQESGRPSLPFRIADRGLLTSHQVFDAFCAMVDCTAGRLNANALLDVAAMDPVRERFGIRAEQLPLVRTWVRDVGVRWGADDAHRRAEGQPAELVNSWRFGLDRLLLGYAMPSSDQRLYAGTLPYPHTGADDAELLGQLNELCETLFSFRRRLAGAHQPATWRDTLAQLLDRTIDPSGSYAHQHQSLRNALHTLAREAEAAGFAGDVDLGSVRHQLDRILRRELPAYGFLSGGITCCQLVPMRGIPFRVVCLLGMSDARFPRGQPKTSFDPTAREHRSGDRNQRDDDRCAFLEAVLSAREHLIVSYVGQDIHTNQLLPACGPVDELLDCLQQSFVHPGEHVSAAGWARERFVLRHPLQPFSPRYFDASDARLFSFSDTAARAASALNAARKPPAAFFPEGTQHAAGNPTADPANPSASAGALSPPAQREHPSAPQDIELAELERYLTHPLRAFLQRDLGLYLGGDAQSLKDREPLELDALERFRLGDSVLRAALAGRPREETEHTLRASGQLPWGSPGALLLEEIAPLAHEIADLAGRYAAEAALPPLKVDCVLAGWRLKGELSDLWPGAQLHVTYSRMGTRIELRQWIRHVVLNYLCSAACSAPRLAHYPRTSVVLGRATGKGAGCVTFRPLTDARGTLQVLLAIAGTARQQPLPLLVRSSRVYAQRVGLDGDTEAAVTSARREYLGSEYRAGGESSDPYIRQVYGDRDPTEQPGFADLALALYGPLLRNRTET
ncbi:MAG: exodeoxyribonuclease V subunit gamma [Proteobacteria bacterium]|nr:exodeoxyribonuclease V subunit gamma [Pseudomonadota bacterium]